MKNLYISLYMTDGNIYKKSFQNINMRFAKDFQLQHVLDLLDYKVYFDRVVLLRLKQKKDNRTLIYL